MDESGTDDMGSVRLYRFDSRGNVAAGNDAGTAWHTLQEATQLVRSTDSSRKEEGLLLIASVLERAISEVERLGFGSLKNTGLDWQAVWTYAVGPELELTSLLRIALEDTNPAIITACSKALYALLSCSANESVFEIQEGIWPGNKSAFTAPVFRRQADQEDGYLGGGRWKYCVNSSELHPVNQVVNPLSDNDEDRELPRDEATVASKDVAAGLIRMGVLTRIQHIIGVDQLRATDQSLLGVVIALSRHSPTAAKSVMRCPRLMDSIIQRFLLTDEDLDLGLRPAHNKAIQLLKVLSQASRANCIRFAETGALQVAQCELYQQGYPLPSHPKLGEDSFKGICATVVECLRLWRVCTNHQIGIALFPDIYHGLCNWLAPLSSQAISSKDADDMLSLAKESYSLLERLAWTLPMLHTEGSVHLNWAWSIAVPLVETALGWLSKDRIAAVCVETYNLADESGQDEYSFRMKLLGTIAQVLHFLSTVCEMFTDTSGEDGNTNGSQNFSLPPFVPRLALILVTNGLFSHNSGKHAKEKRSFLEALCTLRLGVDEVTAMTATSCLHGLVRLVSVIDQLSSRVEEFTGPTNLFPEDSETRSILEKGLVNSVDSELRGLLYVVGKEMIDNYGLLQSLEKDGRAVPAAGLGLGWGQEGGGAWSKSVLHARGVARLLTELLEVLPLKPEGANKEGSEGGRLSVTSDLLWRISCGLSVAAICIPGESERVHRICSNVLLHPDTIRLLFSRLDCTFKAAETSKGFDSDEISKVLSEHYRKIWLCGKPLKSSRRRSSKHKNVNEKVSLISTKLSTLSEESARLAEERITAEGLANEMVAEWAKQRLPLPSHWVYSPLATNLTGLLEGDQAANEPECKILEDGKFVMYHGRQVEMEDSIRHGLVWLLSLQALSQSTVEEIDDVFATIPLVRKVHALSSLFVLGGDMYLKQEVKEGVNALHLLFGKSLDAKQGSNGLLDFESEIPGCYPAFAHTLAHRFVTAAVIDAGFASQVAIYLRQDVAPSIRLSTWRTLAETHFLTRLPALVDCCGDARGYLFPSEKNEELIEAYVSAWISGTFDAAAPKDPVTFAVAAHHISAFLFEEESASEKSMLRTVSLKLVESSMQGLEQQVLLQKLVEHPLSLHAEALGTKELEKRFDILQTMCEGDSRIIAGVQELRSLSLRGTVS